jgi:carbon monoxide dehydrogenase subunit G
MLSAPMLIALTVSALGLSDAEMRAVAKGEVPTRSEAFASPSGRSAGRGWGAIVVERPLTEVWATLVDVEHRTEYMPRLKLSRVLEQKGQRLRVYQEIDASVTTARYTAWYQVDPVAHSIHWSIDAGAPGNTVHDVDGDYRVAELGPGRTLLVYRTYVDSGLHVPQWIQSYMQRRAIPDLLRAIKRRVESGGTWKK